MLLFFLTNQICLFGKMYFFVAPFCRPSAESGPSRHSKLNRANKTGPLRRLGRAFVRRPAAGPIFRWERGPTVCGRKKGSREGETTIGFSPSCFQGKGARPERSRFALPERFFGMSVFKDINIFRENRPSDERCLLDLIFGVFT